MKKIDARGKLCPEPLIITKKAIKESAIGDSFAVMLDNEISTCNLENLLKEMGIEFYTNRENNVETIIFTIGSKLIQNVPIEPFCEKNNLTGNYVVVISSEGMGRDRDGSINLGKILMRGFVNSLSQQDILPKAIIMYNSGVLLTEKDADTVAALIELSKMGVDIILCGVCVDYYDIKDSMQVGRISNMYEITKLTSFASHVVYP